MGSLEEMARATRLSARQLAALEADNFAELPAPVFVKGFIRAYCHFLGVGADDAIARYRDILGEPPASERGLRPAPPAPSWSTSPIFISLLLLVAFGGGLLALTLGGTRGPTSSVIPNPEAGVESAATSATPIPVARPTGPTPAVSPIAAAPAAPMPNTVQRLGARALELTWIRVQIDEGRTVEELLPVGATRQWTAAKRFVLDIGNAGGIALTLNGRPIPPLGGSGAVIRGLELPRATTAGGS